MTLSHSLLLAVLLLVFNACWAHKNHMAQSPVYLKTQISESLSMLSSKGGNIIVSEGKDGLLIIDNGYSDLADNLASTLNQTSHKAQLKYIINTHWHFDHTGANEKLGKNATIIAHDTVRERLKNPAKIPFFKYESGAHPEHALPTLTYPDAMKVHFNNDELQLEHFPNSHTDGDTVIFFKKANLVHMGDLLFFPHFPFIDVHNGGNAISFLNSIKKINARINEKTVVIPGHGAITNKQGLSEFQTMLEQTILEVKTMKDKGLLLEKIQTIGLDKKWQAWGAGFINEASWISFIFQGLEIKP